MTCICNCPNYKITLKNNSKLSLDKDVCKLDCLSLYDSDEEKMSKLKINNKKHTPSRYHITCAQEQIFKPKFAKSKLKRNVPTEICKSSECNFKKSSKTNAKNVCYCTQRKRHPISYSQAHITSVKGKRKLPHCKEIESLPNYSLNNIKIAKQLDLDYTPKSNLLRRLKCGINEMNRNNSWYDLEYTECRQKLEEAYRKLNKTCCPYLINDNSTKPNISSKIFKNSINVDNKIDFIKEIRKENFFETHSTDDLTKKYPKHKCRFVYTIDDRDLLKATNPDAFGTNRCSICNQSKRTELKKEAPETHEVEVQTRINIEDKETQISERKNSSHNFVNPRRISIPLDNESVEIKPSDKKFLKNKIYPTSSWALRFQKGCF